MKNFFDNWQICKLSQTVQREPKERFSWCKFEDEHPTVATLLMAFGQAVFVACAGAVAVGCFYL